MRLYQLAFLLCLLLVTVMSCSTEEDRPVQIEQSDLVGQWDVTVRGALLFIEFTEDNRVLIQDRGAIGQPDSTIYYYQDYKLLENNTIEGLPGNSVMSEITVSGDRLTFFFSNPTNGHRLKYYGQRVEETEIEDLSSLLNRTWITVLENGEPILPEYQKISYFSKTGIFLIKDFSDSGLHMFEWEWNDYSQICYTEYQRPQFIPQPICMSFLILEEDFAEFEVGGRVIRIEPTTLF